MEPLYGADSNALVCQLYVTVGKWWMHILVVGNSPLFCIITVWVSPVGNQSHQWNQWRGIFMVCDLGQIIQRWGPQGLDIIDISTIRHINQTLITLIPKVDNVTKFKDFKPVSSCNISYKLITKTLTLVWGWWWRDW